MNMVRVPITVAFDSKRVIGFMEVDLSQLPEKPDFVMAIGFRERTHITRLGQPEYVLTEVGLMPELEYASYITVKANA